METQEQAKDLSGKPTTTKGKLGEDGKVRGDTLPILVQRAGLQHSSLQDTWDKSVRFQKRQTQVPWAAATASDLSQESGEKKQRGEVCPFVFSICP